MNHDRPLDHLPPLPPPQGSPSRSGPTNQSPAQVPGRSSCGTSSWSCWGKRSTTTSSPGRETTENLSSRTQMRWPACGGLGSANPRWTTTSSAERSGETEVKYFHLHLSHTTQVSRHSTIISLYLRVEVVRNLPAASFNVSSSEKSVHHFLPLSRSRFDTVFVISNPR